MTGEYTGKEYKSTILTEAFLSAVAEAAFGYLLQETDLADRVLRRGFDQLQMEQMVLDYVRAHGRITRGEVMELCRVNENQAGYLLRRLVKADYLERMVIGRKAFYRAASSQKKR